MLPMTKLVGLAAVAVVAISIGGCSHDRYDTAYGPDGYYYDDGYYSGGGYYDGYYHQRYLDRDRSRYGYHIQRDYDGWDGHRGGGRQDISRDVGRGAERHDISRDVGRGGGQDIGRGGGGHGGGRR